MDVAEAKKRRFLKDASFLLSYFGFLLVIFGTIMLLIPALPWIYYHVNVQATSDEVDNITGFIGYGAIAPTPVVKLPEPLPPIDASLSKVNTLIIPRIGVNGPINEGKNATQALYHGIWRVNNFGTPPNNDLPIILAAHRFGYIEWSSNFRKTNSFANLPDLNVGDTFSIIWQQREYIYKVYKKEENSRITDYSADVIMYTCKYLKSPIRIIVYARRQV